MDEYVESIGDAKSRLYEQNIPELSEEQLKQIEEISGGRAYIRGKHEDHVKAMIRDLPRESGAYHPPKTFKLYPLIKKIVTPEGIFTSTIEKELQKVGYTIEIGKK